MKLAFLAGIRSLTRPIKRYTTDFSGFAPENPISEGGEWTNTVSATWTNPVRTVTGPARCVGSGVSSNDAVAMLTGTWSPDHTITAVAYVGSPPTGGEEIELHLRMTMIPGGTDNIHTYEIDIIPALGELVIARWNSFQGDFTVLATFAPVSSISSIVDGDIFVASISGIGRKIEIIISQNGTEIGRVIDSDGLGFNTGSPGIGMDNDAADIFGWRSYTATEN